MADAFRAYRDKEKVSGGSNSPTITGLAVSTDVKEGTYQVVHIRGGKGSAKVDIPTFRIIAQ